MNKFLRRPAGKVVDGLSIVEDVVISKWGIVRGVTPYIAREFAGIFGFN
jgi:hypothetical protein